ncbi:hypothetical protein PENSPDRAFT_538775, partial [Peniophora sp. CONT]
SLFETSSLRPLDPPRPVRLGNDSTCSATHIGTLRLSCKTPKGQTDLSVANALFIPIFTVTLLSVHQLAKCKLSSHFVANGCTVRNNRNGHTVFTAPH